MNAQCNAPISDRFSSLCARVFYRRIVCTIAVMSYVADMSSDVMGYTEPIISCVLSDNTQHKTGN